MLQMRWQLVGAAIVVLVAIGVYVQKKTEKHSEAEADTGSGEKHQKAVPATVAAADAKTESKPDAEPVALDVTAEKLLDDYQANEVAADSKYNDKALRVTGVVLMIRKGITGDPYVVLRTKRRHANVHARFGSDDGVAAIAKGQKIAVRCRGGGMIMGDPVLQDCVLAP